LTASIASYLTTSDSEFPDGASHFRERSEHLTPKANDAERSEAPDSEHRELPDGTSLSANAVST